MILPGHDNAQGLVALHFPGPSWRSQLISIHNQLDLQPSAEISQRSPCCLCRASIAILIVAAQTPCVEAPQTAVNAQEQLLDLDMRDI